MIHGTTRLRDRQMPGKGLNTGEGRQHATYDPRALLPGNIPFQAVIPMPDLSGAVSENSQGTVIALEVTAGSKAESFPAGFNEWRKTIGCRVSAPALEGRANKAVLALIAEKLGVPAASVSIISGISASRKRVLVAGIGKQELLARLDRLR
jgi:uncharacterized protein (TIGR00251 family)